MFKHFLGESRYIALEVLTDYKVAKRLIYRKIKEFPFFEVNLLSY
jgi:hypothetical protein